MSLVNTLKGVAVTSVLSIFSMVGAVNAATYTPDTLLGSAQLGNSGDGDELAALASIAGVDVNSLSIESKDNSGSFMRDDVGNYFVDVAPRTPGYFILKFGVGGTNAVSHYFFQNIADLTKLVWTDAQTNSLLANCTSDCRLSHVTQTGDVSPVPVPAGGVLLLTALGGFALMRRRKTTV
ncbi:VPLPA-CTERM sorting domain-containing protein [Aliiroseovarius sp. S2029]|uniref:VPLPA-CTERM sorting domain-containing protein n=1 Tax=Aliiroseovarius sp. S2029 TaxID=2936988 RepID=UPI0020BE9D83|nr:VPLPA-CTERM sorting domain-containing protein [Aliiroseovarius sp. S2029]MCK8485418.1 VPLPA-CTERM sorting domain-containing protein [Aliiroseovarius sp. S2029]